MTLIINTNVASLNSQRQLGSSAQELNSALERLSSGSRINTAADDAAGLSISNRMTSQIRGLSQAVRNAMDGVSMIQVAEGALEESTSILQRMRELAVQSANGIYADTDRATLDAEVQQLIQEINRIAETTSFNGQSLLKGNQQQVSLQVGADSGQSISFSIPAMDASELGLGNTSGDIVGAVMAFDGDGGLSSAIAQGAIKINGQALGGYAAGTNLQAILDDINSKVSGISARSVVVINAPQTGNGILTGSESITLSGVSADGSTSSFTVSNTSSMEELITALNAKTGDLINASLDDEGKLTLSSEKFATLTLQDTTQGSASGVNQTSIADPDIAEVIEGLTSSWVAKAEDLIEQYLGIKGDGVDLTLDLTYSDGVGDVRARVTALVPGGGGLGTSLTLEIDMADFTATGDKSGGSPDLYLDRIIAHEMVHAVMYRNTNMLGTAMPSWFAEGVAEFIHGADERVEGDIAAGNLDNQGELATAFDTGKIGNSITAEGYSAGYLAVKMMHEEILAAGGDGIKEVMLELAAGNDINTALANVATANSLTGTWNSLAAYEDHFGNAVTGVGYTFMTNELNLDAGVGNETDTGSIAGSDYFVGNDLSASTVIDNTNIGPAQDFNLIIPTEYSGGLTSADAQLILTADNGDAITISLGANGADSDLSTLGLLAMSEPGTVLGQSVSATGQNAALATGDLTINGVSIEAVAANDGLMAKVDAINNVADETGVTAAIAAQQAFKLNAEATVEYTSAASISGITNAGVFGINGIGMTIVSTDTSATIAAKVNNLTAAHGATAYVDDQGRLHLYSDAKLTLGDDQSGNLATELGFTNANLNQGSVKINNTDISIADITDGVTIVDAINASSGITGVNAEIDDSGRLQLRGTAAIKVSLGDDRGLQTLNAMGISFGTNGGEQLTDSNSDKLLGDETFVIDPRIELKSIQGNTISIDVTADGATATGLTDVNAADAAATGLSLSQLSVSTAAQSQRAIEAIDNALETINDTRSQLGAVNNRLDFTVSNLTTIIEKTSAARSRIMDTDFALETAKLSRAQVLQQASQAMLAQANARPQQVLQLLN